MSLRYTHRYIVTVTIHCYLHTAYMWWDPKISWIVKKNLFKVCVQVWNFSPLQSTPPATWRSNPSTAPNAELKCTEIITLNLLNWLIILVSAISCFRNGSFTGTRVNGCWWFLKGPQSTNENFFLSPQTIVCVDILVPETFCLFPNTWKAPVPFPPLNLLNFVAGWGGVKEGGCYGTAKEYLFSLVS